MFDTTVTSFKYFYRITLSSIKDGNCDTSYYETNYVNNYSIKLTLDHEIMNYPKQFLWQTQIAQPGIVISSPEPYYMLPPEPYAYVF